MTKKTTYDDDVMHEGHYLRVNGYNRGIMAHECTCLETKRSVTIDLLVNGDFPDSFDPNELIGKEVYLDYSHPCTYIGVGVKIK